MKYRSAKCPWCASIGKKIFHSNVNWEDMDSTWYKCPSCGSLAILPRPSKEEIRKVYEEDYLKKRHQPHAGVDCRIRYSAAYRPTVFAEYELSLNDVGIERDWKGSILDFGCANGIFLEFAKEYFGERAELYGTDLSESLLENARKKGWNVFPLEMLGKTGQKFDLISLWDVIEHTEDPVDVILKLRKHLKRNGKILLQTPRFDLLGKLYGNVWPHLLPVQHLSIASKEGMQKMAKKARMRIDKHVSFGANIPGSLVPNPYKKIFDTLAKDLDFGDVQVVTLKI